MTCSGVSSPACLPAARGPSTWAPDEGAADITQRLQALAVELVRTATKGAGSALRRDLSRRLLDDP